MYTLYWHPYASSLAPMAVLEEVGVPFELHRVDSEGGECDSAEYRRIQPLGLIPALRLADGSSMFEASAIVQYLSDRHGPGKLAPSVEDPDRARYLQWMHYMAGTVYPTYNRYYWPPEYSAHADGITTLREHLGTIVLEQWQVIEDALQKEGPWMLGQRFSACDIYLQMMTTWHTTAAELLQTFSCVRELTKGVLAREACQRAIHRHGFATGFGADIE